MKLVRASFVVPLALVAGCGFDASGAATAGELDAIAADASYVLDGSSIDDASGDGLFPVDDATTPSDTRVPGTDGCVTDVGCTSPGKCHTGVVNCDGTCSAMPDPTAFGATCDSLKHCTTGTVQCDGSCSAVDPPNVDTPCSSPLGCNKGVIACTGLCNASPDPKEAGKACTGLKCTTPPKTDCSGACPAKDAKAGQRCRCCICIDLSVKQVNYDECGACDGCPGGCTDTICL